MHAVRTHRSIDGSIALAPTSKNAKYTGARNSFFWKKASRLSLEAMAIGTERRQMAKVPSAVVLTEINFLDI